MLTYLLQLSCHSVAVVLTPVQTKQIRINIHKRNSEKHSTNNTKHSKYKYTYYQNTHTYTHQHITKQVKTTAVQDTHQITKYMFRSERLPPGKSRLFCYFQG